MGGPELASKNKFWRGKKARRRRIQVTSRNNGEQKQLTKHIMPRIPTINPDSASAEQQQILANVKKGLGLVPNLVATLVQSPAAAHAYLGFSGALAKGSLPRPLQEQISLVVGETNACDYCVAAHTLLGGKAGLSPAAVLAARTAESADPKTAAALVFARKIVTERGHVTDADVAGLRAQGFTNGEITKIVANTALNIFTNYFNHVAGTVVDFPAAPKLAA
jgi:uncharacterized peroxidase-related enzyme